MNNCKYKWPRLLVFCILVACRRQVAEPTVGNDDVAPEKSGEVKPVAESRLPEGGYTTPSIIWAGQDGNPVDPEKVEAVVRAAAAHAEERRQLEIANFKAAQEIMNKCGYRERRYGANDPEEVDFDYQERILQASRHLDNVFSRTPEQYPALLVEVIEKNEMGKLTADAFRRLLYCDPRRFLVLAKQSTDENGYFDPLRNRGIYFPISQYLARFREIPDEIRKELLEFVISRAKQENGPSSRKTIDKILLFQVPEWAKSQDRLDFLQTSSILSPELRNQQAFAKEIASLEEALQKTAPHPNPDPVDIP